jgi:streptogramin lyase
VQNQRLSLLLILFFSLAFFIVIIPISDKVLTQTTTSSTNESYHFVKQWGSQGSGDGQFASPTGIAVDSSGFIYVFDSGNSNVQKFDSSGNFITKLKSAHPSGINVDSSGKVYVADGKSRIVQKFDSNGNLISKWKISNRGYIAIDSSGYIIVTDTFNNNVQKFDSSGNFITKWGSYGTGNGQFFNPSDIAVDSSNNIYVADYDNHRIQKFDNNGNFISKLDVNLPNGITVDSSSHIYVSNGLDNSIQKFDSNGTLLTKWASQGSGAGQFNGPQGIAVDSLHRVYVVDSGNNRVEVFAPVTQVPLTDNISKITSKTTSSSHDGNTVENINKNITSLKANKTSSILPLNKASKLSDHTATLPNTYSNNSMIINTLPGLTKSIKKDIQVPEIINKPSMDMKNYSTINEKGNQVLGENNDKAITNPIISPQKNNTYFIGKNLTPTSHAGISDQF